MSIDFVRILHLKGFWRKIVFFLINHLFSGTSSICFEVKRKLLNSIGCTIGKGTKIVGPIECTGTLIVGANCWLGKNLKINGNGRVAIGDNCDIAPEVTFQTGGHIIGDSKRRAGKGIIASQTVGNGVWIGGRSTIVGNVHIGDSSVVAACACVVKNVETDTLVAGVPARVIRRLDDESAFDSKK